MTVHIAESANIHQDVESELLSGAERSWHLIVLTPMAQAEINNLLPFFSSARPERLTNLAIGIMTMLVEQGSCELNFQRVFIQQIDDGRTGDGGIAHQFLG